MRNREYSYIHQNVYDLEIDDIFKPIIEDILLRRAYVYEFTKDDIYNDVNRLLQNLKKVRFDHIKENFSGYYRYDKREIVLDIDIFYRLIQNENYSHIYEIIAHEVTHALCCDKDGFDILETRIINNKKTSENRRTGKENYYLSESMVSELSEHLIKKKRNFYTSETKRI